MTDLAAFLLARIAEDEASARNCAVVFPPPWEMFDRGWMATVKANGPYFPEVVRHEDQSHDGWMGDHIEHVARWEPSRVLAECKAKRQLVELMTYEVKDARQRPAWTIPDEQVGDEGRKYRSGYENALAQQLPDTLDRVEQYLRLLALPYADHPDYDHAWRL